jgi:Leucine-rich repeat (LRR) protein
MVIDPLKSLNKLEVLGLFNNEILNDRKTLDVLDKLTNLKELSIDGNPVKLLYCLNNLGVVTSAIQV